MSDEIPVSLSPREGVLLPPEPTERTETLRAEGAAASVRRWPDYVTGWVALGDEAREGGRDVEAYAFYRVGYHRSLDRLRANGWRGAGRVPYSHEPNRAFHEAVAGLMVLSAAFGDTAEADRLRTMLLDSDPAGPLAR